MSNDPDKDVVYFAKTDFRGQGKIFGIKRTDRRQHVYVIGKTGTGKTTLLHNMVVQDIANGEGVCFVDPHGEQVEDLLNNIPKSRLNDVIYFNPADADHHIGFNVLELPDPKYKHLVASGLMGIFTKIWSNVWSARMEYIMNNAILALLDTPDTTLLGINRILTDKDYRQQIITNVKDPVVKAFWINEFEQWKDQFRNEAIAPIQNKVGQFLSTAMIRNIVAQPKSTLDVFQAMNSGKILLVNVSKGRIGEDNSSLLGAMLITKIQLAAMERVRVPEDERVDFYLYVDEFQNFATDSFASVLSEARKYRLNLTLAHQYIGQLVTDTSTRVRDAIFGNAGTMIMFRVGAQDAEFLEPEITPEFEIADMVQLPNRAIYVKLMVNGITSRPFSAATLAPFHAKVEVADREEVVQISRERYMRPRALVEEEINRWANSMGETQPAQPTGKNAQSSAFSGSGSASGPGPRTAPRWANKKEEKHKEVLAGLGIEFKIEPIGSERSGKAADASRRAPDGKQSSNRSPGNRPPERNEAEEEDLVEAEKREAVAALTLDALKPRENLPKAHQRPAADVNKLKDSVSEALAKYLGKDKGDSQ